MKSVNNDLFPVKLVDLTDIQLRYLLDWEHRFFIVSAGRRSRNLGKRKLLFKALENPGHRYIMGAPTVDQADEIFWENLKQDTHYFRIYKNDTKKYVILKNGARIRVVGLDKAERIEGAECDGMLITEMGNVKEEVWKEHLRPMLADTGGFALLDGVPEGKNFYYDLALHAAGNALPKTEPIEGAYGENGEWVFYTWFSRDVLNQAEIEDLKNTTDPRTFRQEYEGSFESYEGLAYWAFSKKNLRMVERDPIKPIHIGMDFNVDPMTAVVCHVMGDEIHQFGEFWLQNSNTNEMCRAIRDKYPVERIIIYPDATGYARSTQSEISDIAMLKQHGFEIRAHHKNPAVKDRINAVNSKMSDSSGRVHYFVNPKNCPKTLNDLNRVETLPDGRLNKTQEKQQLTHISDALGYLIAYLFPIRRNIAKGVLR